MGHIVEPCPLYWPAECTLVSVCCNVMFFKSCINPVCMNSESKKGKKNALFHWIQKASPFHCAYSTLFFFTVEVKVMVKAYKSYPMLGHLHSGEHVKSTLKGSSVPVSLNRGPSCSEVTPCPIPPQWEEIHMKSSGCILKWAVVLLTVACLWNGLKTWKNEAVIIHLWQQNQKCVI